ncbi:MAG TPA: hypothetical protein DEA08_19800, partial [Planctomycetes bacterium]|nr:hypothetical protein [Planctomycetota bacterium]
MSEDARTGDGRSAGKHRALRPPGPPPPSGREPAVPPPAALPGGAAPEETLAEEGAAEAGAGRGRETGPHGTLPIEGPQARGTGRHAQAQGRRTTGRQAATGARQTGRRTTGRQAAASGRQSGRRASARLDPRSTGRRTTGRTRWIGPLQVLEKLGSGAMGDVYLGYDPGRDERCAIKVLAGVYQEDEEALSRFSREVELLRQLSAHPGIVRIHSAGRSAGGRPYLSMELVEGDDLQVLLQQGLEPRRALRLIGEVTAALAHVHAHGYVHRDVKPSNVLIDQAGHAKLADFGLATATGGKLERLTVTGQTLGTPAYMAPEQVTKDLGEIGPWTDVYALGAMIYRALSGTPPNGADTTLAICERLTSGRPPLPLRKARPDALGRQLDAVVMRALSPRTSERYPDAGHLLRALEERVSELAGLSSASGRGPAPGPRPRSPWRGPLGVGLLIAGSLAPILVAFAILFEQEPPHRRGGGGGVELALQAFRAGDLEAALGELPREELSPQSRRRSREPEVAELLACAGEARAALTHPGATPALRARLAAELDDARAWESACRQLPRQHAEALALELERPLPRQVGPDQPEWGPLAAGERALAAGALGLAAGDFARARASADAELRFAGALGLLRVSVASGDLEWALEAWGEAAADADAPLARARCAAWAAYLVRVAQARLPVGRQAKPSELPARLREAQARAESFAPGLPLSAFARQLTRAEAPAPPPELRGPWSLARRRARGLLDLAQRGLDQAGLEQAAHRLRLGWRWGWREPLALARAASLLRAPDRARAWLELAPAGSERDLLELRIAGQELDAAGERLDYGLGEDEAAQRSLAERWLDVVTKARAALARASAPARPRVELALARALLERIRRMVEARADPDPSEREELAQLCAGLGADVEVDRVVGARLGLGRALWRSDPEQVDEARIYMARVVQAWREARPELPWKVRLR